MKKIVLNPVTNKLVMLGIIAKINNLSNQIKRSTSFSDSLDDSYKTLLKEVHPEVTPEDNRVLQRYRDLLSESLAHLGTFFIVEESVIEKPPANLISNSFAEAFGNVFSVLPTGLSVAPTSSCTVPINTVPFKVADIHQKQSINVGKVYTTMEKATISGLLGSYYHYKAKEINIGVNSPRYKNNSAEPIVLLAELLNMDLAGNEDHVIRVASEVLLNKQT